MNYKGTCPNCGKITLPRKFNFCPKCGSIIEEANGLKDINSAYHPSRMPKKVEKILEECGAKTEGEKKAILNSIEISQKPNIISGNAGNISKVSK